MNSPVIYVVPGITMPTYPIRAVVQEQEKCPHCKGELSIFSFDVAEAAGEEFGAWLGEYATSEFVDGLRTYLGDLLQ